MPVAGSEHALQQHSAYYLLIITAACSRYRPRGCWLLACVSPSISFFFPFFSRSRRTALACGNSKLIDRQATLSSALPPLWVSADRLALTAALPARRRPLGRQKIELNCLLHAADRGISRPTTLSSNSRCPALIMLALDIFFSFLIQSIPSCHPRPE
ncbi:hypothetical protein VTN96DRAFT_4483 [Rasamsonia emersonii]